MVLPPLGPSNANPRGMQRRVALRWLAALARRRSVYYVNRRVGLPPGTTHAGLAADYATALELAVDRPDLLRRLVLAATACRMGPVAVAASRRSADLAASGDLRGSQAAGSWGRGPRR